jgi:hypothetical protein
VSGESCLTGNAAIAGLAFEFAPTGGTFPAEYQGALLFADHSRKCIWAMRRNGSGVPAPGLIDTFVTNAANPVHLEFGPDGTLYYVDYDGGTIRRVSYGATPPSGASFQSPVHYPVGANAHGVVIAHLNGDGKPDLAVARSGGSTVSVLLGSGDGGFGSPTSYATGSNPKGVIAADFNGDGNVDLATANQGSNSVSVLLGNGSGSFSAASNYSVCAGAHEVAAGEFSRDDKPDLAVACWGGSVISVLLGTGTGTFGTASSFTAGSAPHSLVVRDFNRDGRHDVAIANHSGNNVAILLGNGDGTFTSPVHSASVLLTSGTAPPPPPGGSQYLSDLSWTQASNGWGPVERDLSNGETAAGDGGPLMLEGVSYAKGLGVHAFSDVRYALGGSCSRFKASVGVDDEVGPNGSVVFEVFAGTTKVYHSGVMTGTTATDTVDVSITGAAELRLVVTQGPDNDWYDHADWAEARIVCGAPAPP